MIRIKETRAIDTAVLADYARSEWETAGEHARLVIAQSERVWLLEDDAPVLYAGVIRQSLLGTPLLWVFLCQGFRPHHLREIRRIMPKLYFLYPALVAYINERFPRGCRFAEAVGLRPRGTVVGGYRVYEARS